MANRTDSFNRADSPTSLGTPSDGGSSWVEGFAGGCWGINGNQAAPSSSSANSVVYLEASESDVDVQATFATIASNRAALIVRFADIDNNWIIPIYGDASLMRIYKSAGTFMGTQLDDYSGTISDGDVIRVECDGDNIKVYQNGVERMSVTDSANNANTKHGFMPLSSTATRIDNFSSTDLAPAFDPATFPYAHRAAPLVRRWKPIAY